MAKATSPADLVIVPRDLRFGRGATVRRRWLSIAWYALGRPGMARKILGAWVAFLLPGFQPWKHDDRKLIALVESDYTYAVLPKVPLAA